MNLPYVYAASVMSGVLFPAFAQIQSDIPRLRRGYVTMTKLTALIAGPSMCAMAIAAPFLVPALYGPRWIGVVLPLQILCAAGYFRALYHVGGIVTQSVGRVCSGLWPQVWYALLVVVGAIVGSRAGLPGVAVGVGVAIVYMFVATGRLVLRITGTSWSEYLRAQRDAIVTSAAVTAFAFIALVMFERLHARRVLTAAGILIAASVPWARAVVDAGRAGTGPSGAQAPENSSTAGPYFSKISSSALNFRV
jgi:PST family polysaccharide transporter